MKPVLVLTCDLAPGLELRSALWEDQERLREWKNANRQSFFFQQTIEPPMQRRWFEAHLERPDDHLFVVVARGVAIGCMAVRLLDDGTLDVYNVIGDEGRPRGQGLMSRALQMMCRFALDRYARPLRLKILTTNPALRWYGRNGFRVVGEHADHCDLELDPGALTLGVRVEELARPPDREGVGE